MVKDKNGLWMGASGKADIESNVDLAPCHTFAMASISKVFTAAAVYRYVDRGVLTLDDPISKWLPEEIVNKVANADQAQIKHLLAHTSGIPDYLNTEYLLAQQNRAHNKWTKKELVEEFMYDTPAPYAVGEIYSYSNANYLLLSMILEEASGLSFEQVYQQEVFQPMNLQSAYYNENQPIPNHGVIGYTEYRPNSGQFYNAKHIYADVLGLGGAAGVAMNAYDLSVFLEDLIKTDFISSNSRNAMMTWFDMPEDDHWEEFGQIQNGYGIEKFDTEYGDAVGHTGSIDGFDSYALYFPEQDMTYVLLLNGTKGDSDAEENIFKETLREMFTN